MKTSREKKAYLKPNEVAEHFKVSLRTVYYWCDLGLLESVKLNGTVRVHKDSIRKFEQDRLFTST